MSVFKSAPVGRRTVLAGLAAALAAAPGAAQAGRDLLDTPALPSAKAASALLLGIARAGQRVVAVGERGIIVWSDDDGATWRQAAVPVSVTLTSVHFPTPAVGWAVGHDGVVLHSTDGGLAWTRRFDGNAANALVLAEAKARVAAAADGAAREAAEIAVEDAQAGAEFGPSRPLLGVWFRTPDDGFVVGSYGQIFRTRDGGRTWASLGGAVNNPDGLHYNAIIAAPSGALLIAGEGGRVYRSVDDGGSWETLDTGAPSHLYGVRALKDGSLLAFGFGGRIFRSEDGPGWRPVPSPITRTLVGAAALYDALVLVDAAGGSIVSSDGGASFRPLRPPGTTAVAAVLAVGGNRMIHVGMGGARVVPVAV
ncbi:MAG TPA: YCF48-related protein [Azospirillum sp.]|nr:YCF48-related protein [Azospirillum sp.]